MKRGWGICFCLVVRGSWLYRIALFLTFLIFKGPVGFDSTTMTGPYLTFMGFANYLFPLAVLEIYFLAQDRQGAFRRIATAALLLVLTFVLGPGLFAAPMAVWGPHVKAAFNPPNPI